MANRLAHRLVVNEADSDDLVQDAFVLAFERLATLSDPQAFAAWLSSILVRTAHKRLRRRRLMDWLGLRRAAPIDLDAIVAPSAPPDIVAEARRVYAAVERLGVEERMALVLHRVEGLTIAEVSERLGRSVATVKRRLSRAEAEMARLRAASGGNHD
jgi:RNA polymerase sigma-70 factor (ECF subfamily)